MKIIPRNKMPKRDYCRAAECRFDFASLAARLNAKPSRGTFDDGLAFPNRYKDVCMELSTGRYASLTQTEMRQAVVEIGLELEKDEFFHEEDLLEVLRELQIDEEYVTRMQGGFTWIPAK